jgi:hypothetical protein
VEKRSLDQVQTQLVPVMVVGMLALNLQLLANTSALDIISPVAGLRMYCNIGFANCEVEKQILSPKQYQ